LIQKKNFGIPLNKIDTYNSVVNGEVGIVLGYFGINLIGEKFVDPIDTRHQLLDKIPPKCDYIMIILTESCLEGYPNHSRMGIYCLERTKLWI